MHDHDPAGDTETAVEQTTWIAAAVTLANPELRHTDARLDSHVAAIAELAGKLRPLIRASFDAGEPDHDHDGLSIDVGSGRTISITNTELRAIIAAALEAGWLTVVVEVSGTPIFTIPNP